MTQTIQSSERDMIETREHVVFSGIKTIELKNVVKNDEDETKRKQEETLRRARWSYKAVEQAAQEAAKQAEVERLRKEEEERKRLEEEERARQEILRKQEKERQAILRQQEAE
jgi:hypothetical protein